MTEETIIETGEVVAVAVEEAVAENVAATEEVAAEAVAEVQAEVEVVAETVAEAVAEPVAEVEAEAESAAETVAEAVATVKEAVEDVAENAVEAVAEAVAAVKEVVEKVTETVTGADEVVSEVVAEPVADAAAAAPAPAKKAEKAAPKPRTLSVGQMLKGTVKRTTDFGAFVDIGVGRDGLVHISELAVGRVQKVTDVLTDGQQVDVWIKKLDQTRNRISLTMISPDTTTIKDLNENDVVPGTVTRIVPYGAFVDIGVGRDGLLHIREMSNGYVAKPEDVVKVGEVTDVRIIALNRRRGRIDLSLKGLRPDDVVEEKNDYRGQQSQQQADEEPEIEVEEISVLSPMELAFKMAMEAEGIEVETEGKGKGRDKRSKRKQSRDTQDAIIARTLETIRE